MTTMNPTLHRAVDWFVRNAWAVTWASVVLFALLTLTGCASMLEQAVYTTPEPTPENPFPEPVPVMEPDGTVLTVGEALAGTIEDKTPAAAAGSSAALGPAAGVGVTGVLGATALYLRQRFRG